MNVAQNQEQPEHNLKVMQGQLRDYEDKEELLRTITEYFTTKTVSLRKKIKGMMNQ